MMSLENFSLLTESFVCELFNLFYNKADVLSMFKWKIKFIGKKICKITAS